MLSQPRIGWKQWPQREPGQKMLFSSGKRAMQTLRKLPTIAPSTKTNTKTTINNQEKVILLIRFALGADRPRHLGGGTPGGVHPPVGTGRVPRLAPAEQFLHL